MKKKKFQGAGEKIPQPSTRNGIPIKTLKEAEVEMSKIPRFKVRCQEVEESSWPGCFQLTYGKFVF